MTTGEFPPARRGAAPPAVDFRERSRPRWTFGGWRSKSVEKRGAIFFQYWENIWEKYWENIGKSIGKTQCGIELNLTRPFLLGGCGRYISLYVMLKHHGHRRDNSSSCLRCVAFAKDLSNELMFELMICLVDLHRDDIKCGTVWCVPATSQLLMPHRDSPKATQRARAPMVQENSLREPHFAMKEL